MKIEAWLYERFPFAFSDVLSWVLHGVLTALPALVLGVGFGWFIAGACGSCFMAGWYWNREDGDLQKIREMSPGFKQHSKLQDSMRDRLTPFAVAFFFALLAIVS